MCRVCTNREISTWDQEPRGAMSLAWKAKERLKVVKKKMSRRKKSAIWQKGLGGAQAPTGCREDAIMDQAPRTLQATGTLLEGLSIGRLNSIWDPHPHFHLELNSRLFQVWWEVSGCLNQKHSWGGEAQNILQRRCHSSLFKVAC